MVQGMIIPADNTAPLRASTLESREDYRRAVGGWMEAVDIADLGVTMYVHEEGQLLGLPFNSRATFLWWYYVPEARQKAMLVGPALVVGLPDRNGDSTDIPRDTAGLLSQPGKWRVEARPKAEPDWTQLPGTYDDYFEALVWALVALERWQDAEDVRVAPGITTMPIRASDAVDLEHPPAV